MLSTLAGVAVHLQATTVLVKLFEAEGVASMTQQHLAVQSSLRAAHTAWAATQAREVKAVLVLNYVLVGNTHLACMMAAGTHSTCQVPATGFS